MRMRILAGIVAVCALTAGMAYAQEEIVPDTPSTEAGALPSAAIEWVKFHLDYAIDPNGAFEVTSDVVLKPLTEQAVKRLSQFPVPFRDDVASLDILHAYTQKSDGRRLDVPPDRMMLVSPPMAAQAPVFSTMKMRVLIFPDVGVGDRLVMKTRLTMRQPDFPGQFAASHVMSRATAFGDAQLSFTYPRSLPLRFDVRMLTEQPRTTDGDRVRRTWTFVNLGIEQAQPGAVDPWDYEPRLIASTFADWRTLAATYEERARPMAVPGEAVRAKADEITKGITDRRGQAQALYEWVSRNVRYVGVYLGAGGFVPHSAESILANRYGDCKDHVTLLEAMLKAKGIDSSAVLVSSAPRFQASPLPTPTQFNHAITWIPSLGVYLDSTAQFLQFGVLNEVLLDKPILRTRGGTALERSPRPSASARTLVSSLKIQVATDGGASGEQVVTGKGPMAGMMRARLSNVDTAQARPRFVASMLRSAGLVGTADFEKDDATVLDDDYSFRLAFRAGEWLNTSSDGAFTIPTGWFAPARLAGAMSRLERPPERVNEACSAITIEEHATLELPTSIKLGALPKPVVFVDPAVTYHATYELTGSTIVASRKLVMLSEHGSCAPAELAAHRRMAEALRRDLRTQVTYRVAEQSN